MRWRSVIVGSLAGATAMWFINRNQPAIMRGWSRMKGGNWFGWMNRFRGTDASALLPDAMK